MTREQIEAWLLIEGWTLRQSRGYEAFYQRGNQYMYRAKGNYLRTVHFDITNFGEDWVEEPDPVPEAELQLIYQEIIKHEKD